MDGKLLCLWCLHTHDFSLEKGRDFVFQEKPSIFWDGKFNCKIIGFTINTSLLYQCNNEKNKLKTMVKWTLVEEGTSTRLILEHSGFAGLKDLMTKIALTGGWKKMMNKTLYNMFSSQNK